MLGRRSWFILSQKVEFPEKDLTVLVPLKPGQGLFASNQRLLSALLSFHSLAFLIVGFAGGAERYHLTIKTTHDRFKLFPQLFFIHF